MMYIELELRQRQLLVTLCFKRKLEYLAALPSLDKSLNCVFLLLFNSFGSILFGLLFFHNVFLKSVL